MFCLNEWTPGHEHLYIYGYNRILSGAKMSSHLAKSIDSSTYLWTSGWTPAYTVEATRMAIAQVATLIVIGEQPQKPTKNTVAARIEHLRI